MYDNAELDSEDLHVKPSVVESNLLQMGIDEMVVDNVGFDDRITDAAKVRKFSISRRNIKG